MTRRNVNVPSMCTLRLNTGSGLAALDDDMSKLMECPVCTEIPLPPIYTCQTGHVICIDCKTKLKGCALCRTPYTNSRNFPLESMVLAAKFYCSNRLKGCPVVATVEELNKHHTICTLRPMKCHLSRFEECKDTILYMSDYLNHLKYVHKSRTLKPIKNKLNVFTEVFEFREDSNYWVTSLFCFDGKVFANQVFKKGPIFYMGFYLVGDEMDASQYAVTTRIQKDPGSSVPKSELTTLVPSIREICEKTNARPNVALHMDLMEKLGHVIPPKNDGEPRFILRWSVEYEIVPLGKTFRKKSNVVCSCFLLCVLVILVSIVFIEFISQS